MIHDNHNSIISIFATTNRVLSCLDSNKLDMLPIYLSELDYALQNCNNIKLKHNIISFLASVPELIKYILSKHNISTNFLVASKAKTRYSTHSTAQGHHNTDYDGLKTIIDIRGLNIFCVIEREIQFLTNSGTLQYWGERLTHIDLPVLRRACKLLRFESNNSSELNWNLELYEIPDNLEEPIAVANNYKITLLTSMFNGEKYIDSFIENLSLSPLFESVNLLIFDANESDKDLKHLAPYLAKYKNIRYFKLKSDPGLYEIWNLGIHMSHTEYIGNANLDDRRHPLQLNALLSALEKDETLDLVSTHVVPMNDYTADIYSFIDSAPFIFYSWMEGSYTIDDLFKIKDDNIQSNCIPHCMPIWRKRIHQKCGYFNEKINRSAADFELWLRGKNIGLTYSIVPVPASYYYVNPNSYMRCDTGHENIAAYLHEIYITKLNTPPPNYTPDFDYLESLIDFSIN